MRQLKPSSQPSGFRRLRLTNVRRALTNVEEDFLQVLDNAGVQALIAVPPTQEGAVPHLVVTLKSFGVFRVVDYSHQRNPSRILDLSGGLVVAASKPSELVGQFYNKLLAGMTAGFKQQAEVLGLYAEVSLRPLDESDR